MSNPSILDAVSDKDVEHQETSTPRTQLKADRDKYARIWLKRYFEFLKANQQSFDADKINEFNQKYPKEEKIYLKWLLTKGVNLIDWE